MHIIGHRFLADLWVVLIHSLPTKRQDRGVNPVSATWEVSHVVPINAYGYEVERVCCTCFVCLSPHFLSVPVNGDVLANGNVNWLSVIKVDPLMPNGEEYKPAVFSLYPVVSRSYKAPGTLNIIYLLCATQPVIHSFPIKRIEVYTLWVHPVDVSLVTPI